MTIADEARKKFELEPRPEEQSFSISMLLQSGDFVQELKSALQGIEAPLILWPRLKNSKRTDPLRRIRNRLFLWANSPVVFVPPKSHAQEIRKMAFLMDFRQLKQIRSAHHIALELSQLLGAELEVVWLSDQGNRNPEDVELMEEMLDWEQRGWITLYRYTQSIAQLENVVVERQYDLVTITHYRHQTVVDWRPEHPDEAVQFKLNKLPVLIFQRN